MADTPDIPGVSRVHVSHDGPNLRESDLKAFNKFMKLVLFSWGVLLVIPWIVVYCPLFKVEPKKFEMIKDSFALMGTYGDFFGVLGALLSAISVLAVAYALILQLYENQQQEVERKRQREREVEEDAQRANEQRKSNLIQALTALSQAHTARYASHMPQHTDEYNRAIPDTPENEGNPDTRRYTVMGRMLHYSKSLENIVDQIREKGDFELKAENHEQKTSKTP